MSRYWTYAEIKQKIEADLDLEKEIFVDDSELMGYVNEAIDFCEGKIHTLYEDYFLAKSAVTLVSGTNEYLLPSDIYANKIRVIIYKNQGDVYPIKRVRSAKKILNAELDVAGNSGASRYEYFIVNQTPGQPKIYLTPDVLEDGERVFYWYLRQANRIFDEADICDIPEFVYYVIQYAKERICFKEGHPNYPLERERLDEIEVEMLGTLAEMVPDEDNEIEADFSVYEDMV